MVYGASHDAVKYFVVGTVFSEPVFLVAICTSINDDGNVFVAISIAPSVFDALW